MYLSEGVENSDFGFVRILISYKSGNRPLLSHLYKVRSVMLLVFLSFNYFSKMYKLAELSCETLGLSGQDKTDCTVNTYPAC